MPEKKVTVRFSAQGGTEVKAEMKGLGIVGTQAFRDINQAQLSAADSARVFEAALDAEDQAFRDLRASLDPAYAATQRYERAVEQATRAVRAGVATQEEANRVIGMARTHLDTFGGAVVASGRGMASYQGQVQNAAFQIGDFAVQVGAGTSASVALAQQLPQLLGGFGILGVVIGTVIAVAIPLARAFFSMGEEAKTAEENAQALASALEAYQAAADAASASSVTLREDYGSLAEEALRALAAIEQLDRAAALRALQDTVSGVRDQYGELANAVIEVQDIVGQFNRDRALGGLIDALDILPEMEDQAVSLAQALIDLGEANGPREVANAAQDALDALVAAVGPVSEMEGASADLAKQLAEAVVQSAELQRITEGTGSAILEAVQGIITLSGNFAAAQSQAAGLRAQVIDVASAAWEAARAWATANAEARASADMGGARPTDGSRASGGGSPPSPTRPRARPDNNIDWAYVADGMRDVGGAASGAADATERFGTVTEVLNRILHEFNTEQARDFKDNMRSIADDAIGGFGDALGDFIESGGRDWDGFMDSIVDSTSDAVAKIVAELATVELAKAGGQIGSLAGPIGAVVGTVAGAAIGFGLGKVFNTDGTPKADARAAQRLEIEKQILALQGKTAKLRQMELEGIDGQNRELAERLMLMQDEARIAAERDGLQEQLLQVQGKEAALRRLALQQLDPSNRELQKRIWLIMDEKTATAEAREARRAEREEERAEREEERAAREAIANEREGLERRYYELTENTVALREMDLALLDPSNHALQIHIWALEDEAKAADDAAAAAERLASALTTDQFASLFEYERAVGVARYGGLAPIAANSSLPPALAPFTSPLASNSSATDLYPVLATIAAKITKIEQIVRKWEKEGQPPERDAA